MMRGLSENKSSSLVVLLLLLVVLLLCHGAAATLTANLSKCPFSRWNGDPRYCYECRWCPFRQSTCCEMEDEINVLKSVNVSGSDYWDCFITIVHFQQCGMCSPSALTYVANETGSMPKYVWNARNLSIRPCKQACRYIHKQCTGAKTLMGEQVVPPGMDSETFCSAYPESSTPGEPCYDNASTASIVVLVLVAAASLIVTLF